MTEGKPAFNDLDDIPEKRASSFFHVYVVVRKLPLRIVRIDGTSMQELIIMIFFIYLLFI